LPQSVHSNGFTPEWLRLCTVISVLLFTAFCHILCTCIYLYKYSHEDAGFMETRNVSHIHYMNTCFLSKYFNISVV